MIRKTNRLIINIRDISHQEIGSTFREEILINADNIFPEFILSKEISGYIDITKISDKNIEANFNLISEIEIECSRCGSKFNLPIKIKFTIEYPVGREINVLPQILEELLLKTPIKPLCKESCKGIEGFKIRKE